jgi:hypothetical protein
VNFIPPAKYGNILLSKNSSFLHIFTEAKILAGCVNLFPGVCLLLSLTLIGLSK